MPMGSVGELPVEKKDAGAIAERQGAAPRFHEGCLCEVGSDGVVWCGLKKIEGRG